MTWEVRFDGNLVWNPANIVGTLFLTEISGLERLFGLRSGTAFDFADEMIIEVPRLELFLKWAFDFLEHTNNGALFAMVEGCLAICIVLNYRITGRWPEVSDRLKPLVERAKTVMDPVPLELKPGESYWGIQVDKPPEE